MRNKLEMVLWRGNQGLVRILGGEMWILLNHCDFMRRNFDEKEGESREISHE